MHPFAGRSVRPPATIRPKSCIREWWQCSESRLSVRQSRAEQSRAKSSAAAHHILNYWNAVQCTSRVQYTWQSRIEGAPRRTLYLQCTVLVYCTVLYSMLYCAACKVNSSEQEHECGNGNDRSGGRRVVCVQCSQGSRSPIWASTSRKTQVADSTSRPRSAARSEKHEPRDATRGGRGQREGADADGEEKRVERRGSEAHGLQKIERDSWHLRPLSPLHRPTRLHSTCYSTEQFTTAYTLRAQRKPSNQTEPKQHATGADAMRLSCICSVESECSPKLFIRRANDARRQRDEMSNRQSIKSSRQQNAQHYCKVKVFTSRFCTSREDKRREEKRRAQTRMRKRWRRKEEKKVNTKYCRCALHWE